MSDEPQFREGARRGKVNADFEALAKRVGVVVSNELRGTTLRAAILVVDADDDETGAMVLHGYGHAVDTVSDLLSHLEALIDVHDLPIDLKIASVPIRPEQN